MSILDRTERRTQMKQKALDLVMSYLYDGIDDYDTNVAAVAEMLCDSFEIKLAIAGNMAKQIVAGIWDEAIVQANHAMADAAEFEHEYYEARVGAY